MSVEDQNPDLQSDESDNEAEQNPDPENIEEDLCNLFNNLTLFRHIYRNNVIIDTEQATEAAAQHVRYILEVFEHVLESSSEEDEMSSDREEEEMSSDREEEEMSSDSEEDELLRTLQEISELLGDLFSTSSSSEEDGDGEVAANRDEENNLQEEENQMRSYEQQSSET
ncbi:protein Ycf2-like [Girardinichthys multiradiatus]|uniref:protein Ycf2-like n=1 Tax=Girardinichthys multiradiatus TaxID=208333 RepID=UPI001FADA7F9|nr:protein Ycf2-like [Girardinichthys multiradiatus]